ncbi:hypothetical protein CT0861_07818 [Colletotrichum tofieldiae]|uniref:Uncharacterized protein n=1 Tax=Colletotrichum tofieldiae TaxID=708197 RepID=A0A161W3H0_9PEZI|nr:hypothetical protein CT0861_07818 [Colletotrichum tofieldiae]
MFFSCRPQQAPRPPRPQCLYAGCSHRALRCDSKSEGKAILSFYCKDHACRQRLGELMCPNYKIPGFSKYCEDRMWPAPMIRHILLTMDEDDRPALREPRLSTPAHLRRHQPGLALLSET